MPGVLLSAAGDVGTGFANSGTTVTVSKPVNAVAGDFLIAVLWNRTNTVTTDFTTPPAGWTSVAAVGGAVGTYVVYSRTALAGDPASWIWAGGSSGRLTGAIFRTTGLTGALDIAGGYATVVGGTPPTTTLTSVTAAQAGDLLIAVTGTNNNPSTTNTVTGQTLGVTVTTTTAAVESTMQVFSETLAAAGASGTRVYSASTATVSSGSGALIALRAVSALVATLSVTPTSGTSPLLVTATAGSTGGTGTAVSYAYAWGDGGNDAASASTTATHTYASAGTFTATVTATNA